MKPPNKFLIIIFTVAIFIAAYQLFSYKNNTNTKRVSPEANKKTEMSPRHSLDSSDTQESVPTSQQKEHSLKNRIRKKPILDKNPFTFIKGLNPYKKTDKEYGGNKNQFDKSPEEKTEQEQGILDIKVTSIIMSKKSKVALINQYPFDVTIGDTIQSEKVLDIKSDHIVLGKNGSKRIIYLELSKDSQIKMEGVK